MDRIPKDLKTGFTNIVEPIKPISLEKDTVLREAIQDALSVLLIDAADIACRYSQESNRTNMSSSDMIYALQYLAVHFMDIPSNAKALERIVSALTSTETTRETTEHDNDTDESEEDTDTDDVSDTDIETDDVSDTDIDTDNNDPNEEFARATNSDFAKEVNRCHDEWDQWYPDSVPQQLIKSSINKTITEFQMFAS